MRAKEVATCLKSEKKNPRPTLPPRSSKPRPPRPQYGARISWLAALGASLGALYRERSERATSGDIRDRKAIAVGSPQSCRVAHGAVDIRAMLASLHVLQSSAEDNNFTGPKASTSQRKRQRRARRVDDTGNRQGEECREEEKRNSARRASVNTATMKLWFLVVCSVV